MENLKPIEDKLIEWIAEEWMLAGHPLTNAFERSLEAKTTQTEDGYRIEIWGNEYGIYMNVGVKASEIKYPFAKKRITGLQNYVKMRIGIGDERESLSIAYAIATKHAKEGMPVRDNGQLGSGFLFEVRKKRTDELDQLAAKHYEALIESIIFEREK